MRKLGKNDYSTELSTLSTEKKHLFDGRNKNICFGRNDENAKKEMKIKKKLLTIYYLQ